MQFIADGPDLPDPLLRAHEEGRVVFFCGAGISYPAGLPDFKGLVDKIYSIVGTSPDDIEQEACNRKLFDATLNLLEHRLPGQRLAVRNALAKALQPKLKLKGATDTHAALLQLARNREGSLRLVTTNFDRIFEHVARSEKLPINACAAPMLPIPKNSRWNGLVYLHGLLPEDGDESALHRLVLTSGDFGLAYLTERWAARFVGELFRNYVVCFVGYSINDPVLRYMMDALAADRMLGEITPQAFALADCTPGHEAAKTIEWKAKGVSPILYGVPARSNDHSALHRTLKEWAETYRDGILGKERIVVEYALARPSASTAQDNFVGRMLWALSDETGLPGKRFADFNPVPALEWLEAFANACFRHGDLDRFSITPRMPADDKLRFSFICRPAPSTNAPWMSPVSGGATSSQWDAVMFQLARWLVRHLNDPALIIWLAERGGQLHDEFVRLIERELDRLAGLEQGGKTIELAELRANAPNAIPGPLMGMLWRLLLTGRVRSRRFDLSLTDLMLIRWKQRFKRDGLTATLRLQLRELLAPKIALEKPFGGSRTDREGACPERLNELVHWELVLAGEHVHSWIADLSKVSHWQSALPSLAEDFQQLLRDALDLFGELGAADEHSDRSHWELPSVTPHQQNRGFHDWVVLIELIRDAWLATREINLERARRIAQGWFALPYPTFKRLALFAASHDGCIAPDRWVDWLEAEDARWLWSEDTHRETMRLLVLQGAQLSPKARARLETAILAGPPPTMCRDDIEPEDWRALVDRSVWLRLAKLDEGGSRLGENAFQCFRELSAANPAWRLSGNQREEFLHWMSVTGDPDYENNRDLDIAPRTRRELADWLKRPAPSGRPFSEDTWGEICRTRFFHSLYALCHLAQEQIWPVERWREAFQTWTKEDKTDRSWRFAAPLVQSMPDDVLEEIAHAVAWWLQGVSESVSRHDEIFLNLCRRILALPHPDSADTDDPVFRAINHPVGRVTQALLNLWFKGEPKDNDTLRGDLEPLFTQLCDARFEKFRHGRVLLAANLIALFRVDQSWTVENLLPSFVWATNPVEAKAVWEGFLWSPRLYPPLLIAFKPQFLSTARHYSDLGKHDHQFAAFLTYAALDPADGYSLQDFQSAIAALPQEGLAQAAQALVQALEAAGEQREDYWKNRVQPFWQQIWPQSRDLRSPQIARSLALLPISARGQFAPALSAVENWLMPIANACYAVSRLEESRLSDRYPEDALRLLDALIDDQSWDCPELRNCLTAIATAAPDLQQDRRYKRLDQFLRRRDR